MSGSCCLDNHMARGSRNFPPNWEQLALAELLARLMANGREAPRERAAEYPGIASRVFARVPSQRPPPGEVRSWPGAPLS